MPETNPVPAPAGNTLPRAEPPLVRTCAGKRKSLLTQFRTLFHYRDMIAMWTARELRSRYRQSLLGIGWTIAQPVIQMIILTVVFGRVIGVSSEGFPYPIFSLVALLPWTLFSSSVATAVPSVSSNMSLVSKIYFPREILPLASILARTVDFAISSLAFVALAIWYGLPFHATLIYVPLLLLLQSLFALGLILLGTAVNVFVRDISIALPLILQIWMFASPVIYPAGLVPERWRPLYALNPMAGIIDSYRRVILLGEPPDLLRLGIAAGLSLGFCAISYAYFKRLELSMSDVL